MDEHNGIGDTDSSDVITDDSTSPADTTIENMALKKRRRKTPTPRAYSPDAPFNPPVPAVDSKNDQIPPPSVLNTESKKRVVRESLKSTNGSKFIPRSVLAGAVAVVIALLVHFSLKQSTIACETSLSTLEEQHPEQSSLVFNSLRNALLDLRGTVKVFMFVYSSKRALHFIQETVEATKSCTPPNITPIFLTRLNFTEDMEEDYGEALVQFGDSLRVNKLMYVERIELLSARVAPAFHSLCDRESPYAQPAIIYLTMQLNGNSTDVNQLAVDVLKSKWGPSLAYNVLDPLITRITDQVFFIN